MKRALLWAGLAFPALTFSQKLTPGDHFQPAQQFEVLNFSSPQFSFGSLKSRPLLLDFWFTSCTACMANIPKLDSIQKKYGSRLQILLVTYEKKEKVQALLTGYKRLRGVSLPVIVGDTLLHQLFPHESVPHKVWIDARGKVVAITDNQALTRHNFEAFLSGQGGQLPPKAEAAITPDQQPLEQRLASGKMTEADKAVQYLFLGSHRADLAFKPGIAFRDSSRGTMGITAINNSLAQLYRTAWRKEKGFHERRLLFIDQEMGVTRTEGQGLEQLYCFEMISSDTTRTAAYARMRRYLDAALGYSSSLQMRCTPVLILRRKNKNIPLFTSASTPDIYTKDGRIIIDNVQLSSVVNNLLNSPGYLPRPVVDETGYTGRVDLDLSTSFTDLSTFNKNFKKYGLYLEEASREMEVIVFQPYR